MAVRLVFNMPAKNFLVSGVFALLLVANFLATVRAQASFQIQAPTVISNDEYEHSSSNWTANSETTQCGDKFESRILDGCRESSRFRFTEFNIYPTFSFLDDQVGNYTEFEFASHTDLGPFELENRTVLNVADLPGAIKLGPTNPGGSPATANVRGNGFGDVLSGFFFSRKNRPGKSHFGVGPVVTFPTASNEIIGSRQWTIGPGAHYSTEIGRLTTGFFIWQSWGLTDDPSRKPINQLFGKPFFIYEFNRKWNLICVPLGLSHSWKSSGGDNWTVPVGGGLRRLFEVQGQKMGIQVQAFDYVARKPKDPEWELRFTIEFLFGE